jgi:hypothetical protein
VSRVYDVAFVALSRTGRRSHVHCCLKSWMSHRRCGKVRGKTAPAHSTTLIPPATALLRHLVFFSLINQNQRIVGSGVLLDPRAIFIFAIIFFPPSLIDNETEMAVYKRAFCLVAMAYTQQAAMAFQPVGRPVVLNQPGCSVATSRSNFPAILSNGPLRMSSSEDDGGVSSIENCSLFFRFSFMRTPFFG